jgi:hypothetical protein
VDRHDVCARAQVSVPNEGVELATGLYEALPDLLKSLPLLVVLLRPKVIAQ